MAERSLLSALFANESAGGQNIANTHEGTSSGQAQGYFQITTGTWDEFGGQQYAPNPLKASYAEQAAIASKIPAVSVSFMYAMIFTTDTSSSSAKIFAALSAAMAE